MTIGNCTCISACTLEEQSCLFRFDMQASSNMDCLLRHQCSVLSNDCIVLLIWSTLAAVLLAYSIVCLLDCIVGPRESRAFSPAQFPQSCYGRSWATLSERQWVALSYRLCATDQLAVQLRLDCTGTRLDCQECRTDEHSDSILYPIRKNTVRITH